MIEHIVYTIFAIGFIIMLGGALGIGFSFLRAVIDFIRKSGDATSVLSVRLQVSGAVFMIGGAIVMIGFLIASLV